MSSNTILAVGLIACFAWQGRCPGQEVLFEDTFDKGLSDKWQVVGLERDDYRVREGKLELRVKRQGENQPLPMLKVELPFSTADTVIASVDVRVIGEGLQRGDVAGLCLLDPTGVSFSARKTNIDGYFVLAPGEVDFIGKPGQEGDPGKYTVKFWPADESLGPLRIVVRGAYAHFQVGPSAEGGYKTFFHSAIRESNKGMGFGVMATGGTGTGERWVRFDNFRVSRS